MTPRSWNQATASRKTSTAVFSGLVVPGLDADDAGVVIDHGAPEHITTCGRAWDGPVVVDDQPSELGVWGQRGMGGVGHRKTSCCGAGSLDSSAPLREAFPDPHLKQIHCTDPVNVPGHHT